MPAVYSTYFEKCKVFFHNYICKNQTNCSDSIIRQLFQVTVPQVRKNFGGWGEKRQEKKCRGK